MFELVVGEIDAIIGNVEEEPEFPDLVLDAWLEASEAGRIAASMHSATSSMSPAVATTKPRSSTSDCSVRISRRGEEQTLGSASS